MVRAPLSPLPTLTMPPQMMRQRRGQAMAEYLVLVVLVALATLGVITLYGNNLRGLFGQSADGLAGNASVANDGTPRDRAGERAQLDNFEGPRLELLDALAERLAEAGDPGDVAGNAARHELLKEVLRVAELANPLVESLRETGRLPPHYLTKALAEAAGWKPGKALWNSAPGAQIGGDVFQNTTGIVPAAPGRVWYEADVGLVGNMGRNKQQGTRLLYSDDGLLYVTFDHYETAEYIGRWK
jgi:Flp pilus assembly pilin Flp